MTTAAADFAAMTELFDVDRPELVERVTRAAANGREVELFVHDMRCSACTHRIAAALDAVPGVGDARLEPARRLAVVEYDPARTSLSAIVRAIETAGYTPTFAGVAANDPERIATQRSELKRLGVAGIAMMQVMMFAVGGYAGALEGITPFYASLMRWSGLAFTLPVLLYSAQPFFWNAARSIRQWAGKPGSAGLAMDVPVSAAILLAFVASVHATVGGNGDVYYDSITMFTFFLLTARHLEQRVRHRLTRFDHWLSLLPQAALRVDPTGAVAVPVEQLRTDDVVLVPLGSRLPADGFVASGAACLDEASLTGESGAIEHGLGEAVYAGTINVGQSFTLRVSNARAASRIAAIERLATRATLSRPAIVASADRFAQWFVVALLVLAAGTALAWLAIEPARAFPAMVAVLVVSCPCALSLATPAAITAATMALRRRGFVVTRAHVLERLARADTVIFDKTGTLSTGTATIDATQTLGPLPATRCLAIAAALERHTSHPLARAFAAAAARESVAVPGAVDVHVRPGAGIEGTVDGIRYRLGSAAFCGITNAAHTPIAEVLLARHEEEVTRGQTPGDLLARFMVRDALRDDARATVAALTRLGLAVEGLSGDAPEPCRVAAAELGIAIAPRVAPEAKLERIRELTAQGRRVVMIGDGVNDTPSLAAATVSIAPADATDLACSSSDALLLSRGIAPLVDAFEVARRTQRVIRQNLVWAFGYNLVCIPLAAAALLPAWAAALGMSFSSLAVMLNALRLVRARETRSWK